MNMLLFMEIQHFSFLNIECILLSRVKTSFEHFQPDYPFPW